VKYFRYSENIKVGLSIIIILAPRLGTDPSCPGAAGPHVVEIFPANIRL
jgi:hypothetical protein